MFVPISEHQPLILSSRMVTRSADATGVECNGKIDLEQPCSLQRHGKRLSSEMLREQTINLFPFARSAVGSPVEGKYLSLFSWCTALSELSHLFLLCGCPDHLPVVFLERKKHPALLSRIMNLHISLCISFHHLNVSMRPQR